MTSSISNAVEIRLLPGSPVGPCNIELVYSLWRVYDARLVGLGPHALHENELLLAITLFLFFAFMRKYELLLTTLTLGPSDIHDADMNWYPPRFISKEYFSSSSVFVVVLKQTKDKQRRS
jgi:hypothetical protein